MITRLLFTGFDATERHQWIPLAGIVACLLIAGVAL